MRLNALPMSFRIGSAAISVRKFRTYRECHLAARLSNLTGPTPLPPSPKGRAHPFEPLRPFAPNHKQPVCNRGPARASRGRYSVGLPQFAAMSGATRDDELLPTLDLGVRRLACWLMSTNILVLGTSPDIECPDFSAAGFPDPSLTLVDLHRHWLDRPSAGYTHHVLQASSRDAVPG